MPKCAECDRPFTRHDPECSKWTPRPPIDIAEEAILMAPATATTKDLVRRVSAAIVEARREESYQFARVYLKAVHEARKLAGDSLDAVVEKLRGELFRSCPGDEEQPDA